MAGAAAEEREDIDFSKTLLCLDFDASMTCGENTLGFHKNQLRIKCLEFVREALDKGYRVAITTHSSGADEAAWGTPREAELGKQRVQHLLRGNDVDKELLERIEIVAGCFGTKSFEYGKNGHITEAVQSFSQEGVIEKVLLYEDYHTNLASAMSFDLLPILPVAVLPFDCDQQFWVRELALLRKDKLFGGDRDRSAMCYAKPTFAGQCISNELAMANFYPKVLKRFFAFDSLKLSWRLCGINDGRVYFGCRHDSLLENYAKLCGLLGDRFRKLNDIILRQARIGGVSIEENGRSLEDKCGFSIRGNVLVLSHPTDLLTQGPYAVWLRDNLREYREQLLVRSSQGRLRF